MKVLRRKFKTNEFGEKEKEPFETEVEEVDLNGYYDLMRFEKTLANNPKVLFRFSLVQGEIHHLTKITSGYIEEIRIIG